MLWLSKAVEGNWLIGFGHDCEIDFTRVITDPKAKFVTQASRPAFG